MWWQAPVNGVAGSTSKDETPIGSAQGLVLTEEAVGDVESPRTPENRIVGAPDGRMREMGGPLAGCTAVVAAIRGTHLVVANAGDSRSVAVFAEIVRKCDITQITVWKILLCSTSSGIPIL